MKDENIYFYNESEDSDFVDTQLESFDEFSESVILEAIQHMTAAEKADAKKYRNSAAGKKAIAKHLKKASKAGYKVDKELSKKMKKVASMRNEEFDYDDEEMCESYLNSLDPSVLASVDTIVEELINFAEACNVDDEAPSKDPETGEEIDEVTHMSAAAKAKAKKYRMSAAGKKAIAKHLKKASKAGYKVDKELSKKMKKVASMRNEEFEDSFELDEDANALSELIFDAMLNSEEILEACKKEGCEIEACKEACKKEACKEACKKEGCDSSDDSEDSEETCSSECEIKISYDDDDMVQSAAKDNSVEAELLDDSVYLVKGCCDNIEDFLDDLGLEDDIEEYLTDSDCNEAIKHMSAAAKAAAKRYRNSAAGKKALKKYAKKRSKAGYKVNKELSKKMKKVAAMRTEAIKESLDSQFSAFNSMFGSLNESETAELKSMMESTIKDLLHKSEDAIFEDVTNAYQDYINEEFMPEVLNLFDTKYVKEILEDYNDKIDAWLSEASEEVVEELKNKNLIVKSRSSIQNEEFVDNLLSLIKDNLKILPEQEDYIDSTNKQIDSLNKKLQETHIECAKLKDKLDESMRLEYAFKNIPSDLFESEREKLIQYVESEGTEADSFEEFKECFDEAVEYIMSNRSSINEETNASTNSTQTTSSLFDSILRLNK